LYIHTTEYTQCRKERVGSLWIDMEWFPGYVEQNPRCSLSCVRNKETTVTTKKPTCIYLLPFAKKKGRKHESESNENGAVGKGWQGSRWQWTSLSITSM
jgi:hypothetical protein